MFIVGLGAVCFGLIIGWITYWILRADGLTPGILLGPATLRHSSVRLADNRISWALQFDSLLLTGSKPLDHTYPFPRHMKWVSPSALRGRSSVPWMQDLTALLGIIAGAAVLAFFRDDAIVGWYVIGLVSGFFAYFALDVILPGKQEGQPWRLE